MIGPYSVSLDWMPGNRSMEWACLLRQTPQASLQLCLTVCRFKFLVLLLVQLASTILVTGVCTGWVIAVRRYWQVNFETGIKVQQGWTYTGSFYAKSDTFTGTITVSLTSAGGTTFDSKSITGVSKSWKKFTFQFQPTASATDENNVFRVVVDGASAAGKIINFGMFSLFPPTFRGRENGMRIDLAEALAATQPSIWRFPGGNNLEVYFFPSFLDKSP